MQLFWAMRRSQVENAYSPLKFLSEAKALFVVAHDATGAEDARILLYVAGDSPRETESAPAGQVKTTGTDADAADGDPSAQLAGYELYCYRLAHPQPKTTSSTERT